MKRTFERMRASAERAVRRAAPWIVALDGLFVILGGVIAVAGAVMGANQGGDLGLLIGGVGGCLIGLLMVFRSRLELVRTVLVGLTAGYFALQLSVFQVATARCDVNEIAPECHGLAAGATPYGLFDGPLVIAAILVLFLIFEPLLHHPPAAPITSAVAVPPGRSSQVVVIDHEAPPPMRPATPALLEAPRADGRRAAAAAAGATVAGIIGALAIVLARVRRRR